MEQTASVSKHEDTSLNKSATGDDVDGRKKKHKSKGHKKKKENKRHSQGAEEEKSRNDGQGPGDERRSAVRSKTKSPRPHTPKRSAHEQTGPKNDQTTPQQGSQQSPKAKHSSKKKKHQNKKLFEEYWSKEDISASLKRGEIYQGVLRISPRNYEMAWVTVPGFKRDIALLGMTHRNRALNGDVVAIAILPQEKWSIMAVEMKYHAEPVETIAEQLLELKMTSDEGSDSKSPSKSKSPKKKDKINVADVPEEYLQRTGKVVYIIEKKHARVSCGYLRPMANHDDPDALFSPTDSRIPRMRIPRASCPPGFFDRPQDFATTLLIARITDWKREAPLDSYCAAGCFARSLGEAGEIEPETDGILMVNDIDTSPFSEAVLACLPQELPWKIPEAEIGRRRDFRDTCIFTIDPATARDLDDAVHCDPLEDDMFEVGVHIADVSYFIKEGSELDQVASDRATSTYMVQKVIPMLPRLLCEELCSLNPGEDRLSFSVVWKMTKEGVIKDEWMGKGLIRSRVKLAYQHAQDMIDNPGKEWGENEHPPLANDTTISEIVARVQFLNQVAINLRKRRFENGTLRLNKAKIAFDLDGDTGLPLGWHPYIQKASNELIEEFMLLANMAVAHRIYDAFPEKALLRSHPKPDERQLTDVQALCSSLQINFSHESSKSIQESLNAFPSNSPEHLVLSHMAMKPMKPALYFSSGSAEGDTERFVHYALSVPLYTHFTSPIRRFPDVIVHRLLAASLKIHEEPAFTSEALDEITTRCNDRKLAAKRAGEASVDLYLGAFIRECGPLAEEGIIVSVLHESLDILVPHFGIIKRVYFKFCERVKSFDFEEGNKSRPAKVHVTWRSLDDKKDGKDDKGEKDGIKDGREDKKDGGKEDKKDGEENKHKRTELLTIFSRVRIVLATEDKKKNKGGVRFSGEILPYEKEK